MVLAYIKWNYQRWTKHWRSLPADIRQGPLKFLGLATLVGGLYVLNVHILNAENKRLVEEKTGQPLPELTSLSLLSSSYSAEKDKVTATPTTARHLPNTLWAQSSRPTPPTASTKP